jgi:hypothetical protein
MGNDPFCGVYVSMPLDPCVDEGLNDFLELEGIYTCLYESLQGVSASTP